MYRKITLVVPQRNFQLKECAHLLQFFLNALDKRNLSGFNYNRYYKKKWQYPKVEIRFNFEDQEEGEKVVLDQAKKLVSKGEIIDYTKFKKWDEPEFVIEAHNKSSKCALTLDRKETDKLLKHPSVNAKKFMLYFVYALLNEMGYSINLVWASRRPFSKSPKLKKKIRKIVTGCASDLAEDLSHASHPGFVERFIHTLFNCTGLGKEEAFWFHIFRSELCKNWSETWNSPKWNEETNKC